MPLFNIINSMGKNDDNKKDSKDKVSASKDRKIEDMEDWRNEHGQPSFKFLQSLADDGSLTALEKLRSIAEDLDISYDLDTPIAVSYTHLRAHETDSYLV